MRAEASVFIRMPVASVFPFVAEVRNIPRWASGVLDVEILGDEDPGLELKYRITSQLMGKRLERTFEITKFEENSKIAYESFGNGLPISGAFRFDDYDSATRLVHESTSEPGDFYGADSPALRRVVRRHVESNLCNLRDLIEARRRM